MVDGKLKTYRLHINFHFVLEYDISSTGTSPNLAVWNRCRQFHIPFEQIDKRTWSGIQTYSLHKTGPRQLHVKPCHQCDKLLVIFSKLAGCFTSIVTIRILGTLLLLLLTLLTTLLKSYKVATMDHQLYGYLRYGFYFTLQYNIFHQCFTYICKFLTNSFLQLKLTIRPDALRSISQEIEQTSRSLETKSIK